jgi:16S rRNA (cytosine967-C5)-methyltransferase
MANESQSLPAKADRRAALVLRQVEAALCEALAKPGADPAAARAPADATVRNLLLIILRRRATLDWLIDRGATGRTRDGVRRVLWWALAEALCLDGLPVPVIVDTAVEHLGRQSRGEAAFANALLRRTLAPGRAAILACVQAEAPAWVRLDLGQALYAAWSRRLLPEALARLAARLQEPAPVVVRCRAGASAGGAVGIEPLPALDWAPEALLFRCLDPQAFFASAAWRRHAFYVQDASTLMAPSLLAPGAGERVADLCCAPGGKSLLLSEAVGATGRVFCCDRSLTRMRRVRENLAGATNAALLVADARRLPLRGGVLDAVLLDVPCSNTGVVRRRPDVRWHFSVAGRDELAADQARILAAGAHLLRPGGRLVYSTCSLEPEENTSVVRGFLAAHSGYVLEQERLLEPGDWHDGGYAARIRRLA